MRSLITEREGSRVPPALLALASLAAALLIACGSADEVATVDGEPITFDEVAALIPDTGDTVDVTRFANSLMLVVADRVMSSQAEEQFGVVRTEQQIDAKLGELLLRTGLTAEQIYETYGLTETLLRLIAARELTADQVTAELVAGAGPPSEEELMAIYEASLGDISQVVCAAHILVETEEEGNATYDRAVAGEDFAALAMELSTGPSGPNGGDLGCSSPATYVEEFAAATLEAEVGVPFGPVQTTFGWHVILVNKRLVPTFEDVRDRLAENLRAEGILQWEDWLTQVLAEAEVAVEPEYGTWTTTGPSPNIVPPES